MAWIQYIFKQGLYRGLMFCLHFLHSGFQNSLRIPKSLENGIVHTQFFL